MTAVIFLQRPPSGESRERVLRGSQVAECIQRSGELARSELDPEGSLFSVNRSCARSRPQPRIRSLAGGLPSRCRCSRGR